LGLAGAAALYLLATQLYPGGSQFDAGAARHSHLRNYLCDLFERAPYGHLSNPGRPFGIAALVALALSLVPLTFALPRLMRPGSLARRCVPALGSGGGVCGSLVFTPLHDEMIVIGFAFTALAFLLSLFELWRAGFLRLALLGLWPLFVGGLNFALWQLKVLVPLIPLVQKCAITGLMLWMALVASILIQQRDSPHSA
jgi:hypothetical protein